MCEDESPLRELVSAHVFLICDQWLAMDDKSRQKIIKLGSATTSCTRENLKNNQLGGNHCVV